ncbi:aldo/keto reductase [Microbacterium sp. A196]|uniref:aldo/keto reductase n=1 Tax=unclassified Microbacterium TaxID=2609290 RepID=UPI003F3139EE
MADISRQLRSLEPRIALGTNAFGWTASTDESAAVLDELLNRSTSPILLDTADVYTAPGSSDEVLRTSEGVIGAWLSSRPGVRERTLIASKVGGGSGRGLLSADAIRRGAEGSLGRLNTDHLDVFYAHKDDPTVPLEETVTAFDALVSEGLIRGVGLSTYTPERMREWIELADRIGARRPVAVMQRYNLISRRSFERDYLPIIAEFSLAGFAYFVLASGLLTGKFSSQDEVTASARAKMTAVFTKDEAFTFVEILRDIARQVGRSPAAVATAWMTGREGVTAPVVGARTPQQLSQILDELAPLPSETAAALTEASMSFA